MHRYISQTTIIYISEYLFIHYFKTNYIAHSWVQLQNGYLEGRIIRNTVPTWHLDISDPTHLMYSPVDWRESDQSACNMHIERHTNNCAILENQARAHTHTHAHAHAHAHAHTYTHVHKNTDQFSNRDNLVWHGLKLDKLVFKTGLNWNDLLYNWLMVSNWVGLVWNWLHWVDLVHNSVVLVQNSRKAWFKSGLTWFKSGSAWFKTGLACHEFGLGWFDWSTSLQLGELCLTVVWAD